MEARTPDLMRWWRTEFGPEEAEAVAKALRDCHVSQGPITQAFEARLAAYIGVPHVICTTSGTTALTMACLGLGLGRGDEVIIPDVTWIATAHAVMLTGAKPVLADVSWNSPILDPEDMAKKITPRTRAIMPVHLNGRGVRIDGIRRHTDLPIIEDAAQCIGSRDYFLGHHLGTQGIAGCFSLSIAKLIGTGQGGFIATRDDELAARLRLMRTHAIEAVMLPRVLQWDRWGYNFRYTDIQAAIGLVQLDRLPARIKRSREIYYRYRDGLPAWLPLIEVPEPGVPLYVDVLYPHAEDLRLHLRQLDIEARPFHPPLDSAPYLDQPTTLSNSQRYKNGLVLPCGPARTDAEIDRVLEALHAYPHRNP